MGSFWYGVRMKTFAFSAFLLIFPVLGFALTTEEYLGLMPELLATQSNTWLAIYTMCTGSLLLSIFWLGRKLASKNLWRVIYPGFC